MCIRDSRIAVEAAVAFALGRIAEDSLFGDGAGTGGSVGGRVVARLAQNRFGEPGGVGNPFHNGGGTTQGRCV